MLITRVLQTVLSGNVKTHFGQWAEDVLVRKLFPRKYRNGIYLDLGAYHPFQHSNTAGFWLQGWRGINVDANDTSIKLFNKTRTQDQNLWLAVIPQADYENGVRAVEFALPEEKKISAVGTCDPKVCQERKFAKRQQVPAKSVRQIVLDAKLTKLDYLNVDIEGYDDKVIQDFDFSLVRPKVITVEDYSTEMAAILKSPITATLMSNGYDLIARAGLTSLFIAQEYRASNTRH